MNGRHDFDGDGEQLLRFDWTTSDAVVERYAIKEFHDYEGAAILLADIVYGANAPG